ncbi:hypothetical protein [Kumtagia ephedrae]|uniref:hypothetical protein n=1 Tax=Kumtagia ephedrae TaxID=2116701 RepID=UPI0010575F62|nr:hypothetical protein [Mesorhizobium ephedrae]
MNLKDFVRTTLLEIMEGVASAQQEWNSRPNSKGVINPVFGSVQEAHKYTRTVKFDVAVTVSEAKEGSGNAGLKIWSVELGASGALSSGNSTVSRVEFEIPVNPAALIVES